MNSKRRTGLRVDEEQARATRARPRPRTEKQGQGVGGRSVPNDLQSRFITGGCQTHDPLVEAAGKGPNEDED